MVAQLASTLAFSAFLEQLIIDGAWTGLFIVVGAFLYAIGDHFGSGL